MALMIGSRNGATSPFQQVEVCVGDGFHACHAERGICDLHTFNAQQHKNIPTIRGKPLHLAQARSLAFDSF